MLNTTIVIAAELLIVTNAQSPRTRWPNAEHVPPHCARPCCNAQ